MAALLLAQILPVFSVVAPCLPGAALRDLCRDPRGQDTSRAALIARWNGVVAVPWTTSVRTGSLPRRAESSSYSATVYRPRSELRYFIHRFHCGACRGDRPSA